MSSKYTQFHRIQINRAQAYIRENLLEGIRLPDLAVESGASQYHLIRLFSACTGETPFEYLQRLRVLNSLKLLETSEKLTNIALEVGYENQSSFNKAFKKWIGMAPTEYRNLGKVEKEKIQYLLSMNAKQKEYEMKLNLSETPETLVRPARQILTISGEGPAFSELAPMVWQNFFGVVAQDPQDLSGCEFLGISYVTSIGDIHKHHYKVALTIPPEKKLSIKGMLVEQMPEQKYLKFLLKGAYQGVWPAFEYMFRYVTNNGYQLASQPCIENYLNDPNITPESELLTELLIPIAF
jgi:AraC family transcriptional regulator